MGSNTTALTWAEAVKRGDDLVQLMRADGAEATKFLGQESQSKFIRSQDLEDSGWIREIDELLEDPDDEAFEGKEELASIGVKELITWTRDEREPLKFGGTYSSYYDLEKKIIYCRESYSPSYYRSSRSEDQSLPVPPLKHWSDVTYLEWARQTKGSPQSLKYVCQLNIENKDTVKIVNEALSKAGPSGQKEEVDETFTMASESGKALLGTPLGCGVAFLLINHKDVNQMGLKEVDSVRVFTVYCRASVRLLHLVFSIKDVKK